MAYIGQKPGSNFRDVTIKDSFTGDGSTVVFDLSKSFNQAGQNDLEVFVDNVRQEPTTAYTVGQDGSGDFKRLTFTAAPAASASIYVLNQGETSGVLSVSDGSVTSGKLGADVITGQTELAEAANNADTVLLHDTSASSLKKIQVSNLTAQAGDGLSKTSSTLAVDIPNTTLLNEGAASNDEVLIFDTSASVLKSITQTNLLNFPTVSSVSPTNVLSGDGTGNHTIVITGAGFTAATASLVNNSGSVITFDSQSVDSATQITGVVAKSKVPGSGEPYDIRVSASSGLASTLENQINVDQSPVFSTAAGSLGTVTNGARGTTTFTVAAADPESGGDPVYSLESGSLPAGCSLTSTSSGAVLSGFDAVGTNTTSTFTIRAKDAASNVSDREFTITVQAPVSQSFTSSGTFSVPSGVSSVDVLVVAGGGAGHGTYHGAGGGAGGLVYRPGFTVTPGGTVSVTVGDGGTHPHSNAPGGPASDPGRGEQSSQLGQDSVFGTLTAKGGGRGGGNPSSITSLNGGSGGGTGQHPQSAGTATQPTQSGDSGNYGFGNSGGTANTPGSWTSAGGGGGAGAAGGSVSQPAPGSPNTSVGAGSGGAGKAYTIADGTTSVYYAGGGGGSAGRMPATGAGGQGGGGAGSTGRGEDGTANRGGGGGGGERNSLNDYPGSFGQPGSPDTNFDGGSGGKGIVIVSY